MHRSKLSLICDDGSERAKAVELIGAQLASMGDAAADISAIQALVDSASRGLAFSPEEQAAVQEYLDTLTEPLTTFYALFREGHKISEIATLLGADRKTVYEGLTKILADLRMLEIE